MTSAPQVTHWTTPDRARHFILPDDAALAPGAFALRTSTGRERSVDEAAVAPYEVSEDEARAWATEQLGQAFGEIRGQTLDFVQRLRQKTADLRAENRRAWDQAVADAPPEVREAGSHLRGLLKDLAATLRQAAREHGAGPDAPAADDADGDASRDDLAAARRAREGAAGSSGSGSASASNSAPPATDGNPPASSKSAQPAAAPAAPPSAGPRSADRPSAGPPSIDPPPGAPQAADPPSARSPSGASQAADPPSASSPSTRPASDGPASDGPTSDGPTSAGPTSDDRTSAGPASAVDPPSSDPRFAEAASVDTRPARMADGAPPPGGRPGAAP